MNTDEVIKILRSGELEEQVAALNKITEFTELLADESLRALAASRSPTVLAEALFRFGAAVRGTLERKFLAQNSTEPKTILAALLVQLGSNVGVEHLIETVKTSTGYENLAATSLARTGVKAACPALIEKLEKLDDSFYTKRESAPYILAFLVALEQLGGALPPYLKERFTAPGVPADLARFVR
jgi:HEAT repeat protein